MTEFTVFYSWQSDLPRKLGRDIIHGATDSAIQRLRLDAALEDSPRIDHDTKDVSGTPEIAGTIYGKIRECGIFIADVSFIGESTLQNPERTKFKLISNPNVMTELGYAAGTIGWDRVILVMNKDKGQPEDLPVDLRNRRFPLTFTLSEQNRKDSEKIQQKLSEDIEVAIRSMLQSEHAAVEEVIASLDLNGVRLMRQYGHAESIHVEPRTTMGQVLGNSGIDAAITRLLDRKVLRCAFDHANQDYVYTWTYLGKLVLVQLGVRASVRQSTQPAIQDIETYFRSINVGM